MEKVCHWLLNFLWTLFNDVSWLHIFHMLLVVGSSLKELRHRSCILKKLAELFKIVISNLFQSSPSSAILVPFCFRTTPLVFPFVSKSLVLGFSTQKPWLTPSKTWPKISWRSSFKNVKAPAKRSQHFNATNHNIFGRVHSVNYFKGPIYIKSEG